VNRSVFSGHLVNLSEYYTNIKYFAQLSIQYSRFQCTNTERSEVFAQCLSNKLLIIAMYTSK
jgi:hypothetical protein